MVFLVFSEIYSPYIAFFHYYTMKHALQPLVHTSVHSVRQGYQRTALTGHVWPWFCICKFVQSRLLQERAHIKMQRITANGNQTQKGIQMENSHQSQYFGGSRDRRVHLNSTACRLKFFFFYSPRFNGAGEHVENIETKTEHTKNRKGLDLNCCRKRLNLKILENPAQQILPLNWRAVGRAPSPPQYLDFSGPCRSILAILKQIYKTVYTYMN